ncbi:hypothetical protein [Rhizobium leguminosarum]|uniref:hypothetical protein n=1 Tax=Rhizobium leguminosarum TaxID=384 RepID=UPI003F98E548
MRRHRLKQITFLDGAALGAFFATEIFLIAFMMLDLGLKDESWVGFFGSIVVSGFSVGAAYIALRGNRIQITQTNDLENERRANSLVAARAVLPAILGEMSLVARNNLMLRFQPGHVPVGFDAPQPNAFQPLSENVIPHLKECIEHADKISQERLANILRHFQVQQARQQHIGIGLIQPNSAELQFDILQAITDAIGWAIIYALISDAFAFARGSRMPIPATLSPERLSEAFVAAGIILEMYPHLQQILQSIIEENRLERQWV